MKCVILLSGGKDSVYAAYLASQYHDICGAICMKSLNSESYMFHTPNIDFVKEQAKALNIPLILKETQGLKEEELNDLHNAIKQVKEEWGAEGIITGAVASQYQASRVQEICYELNLWSCNPLWQINQIQLLEELLNQNFKVIISGVFAYPFDNSLLGKTLSPELIELLKKMQEKYQINPAGEGGEIETFVTDCPLFSHELIIKKASKEMDMKNSGLFQIQTLESIEKPKEQVVKRKSKTILPWQKNSEKESSCEVDVCIISCVSKDQNLFEWEYIRPIVDVCKEENKSYSYIHIEDLAQVPQAKTIIISGTAIKDNKFLESASKLDKIFQSNKPILGICAGAECLGLYHGEKIHTCKHIGAYDVTSVEKDELGEFINREEYFLHQEGFKKEDMGKLKILATIKDNTVAFFRDENKPHYGVQFHPELNNKILIVKFLNQTN